MGRRRIAVVGLGMAVAPHAQSLLALADRVDVVGCYSGNADRRMAFADRFHLPVTDDLDALFADDSIDALFLLTPPTTHLDLVRRAAASGKHVLLEKPLEVTLDRSRAVADAMDGAGLTLAVMFQHRFRPVAQRLAGLLADGRLGPLLMASASIHWWRPDSYFAQPGRGMKARDGGGVLLTQGIHTLDLFVSLVGLPEEVSAHAVTSPLRRIDTEDIVSGSARFAGGAIGAIEATTVAYPGFAETIVLAGKNGTARLASNHLHVALKDGTVIDDGSSDTGGGGGADPMAFSHEPHQALITDFLDAIDEHRPAVTNGREAFKVHALIDTMLRAAETGRHLPVPQA